VHNIDLASFLRWYVMVEIHDPTYAKSTSLRGERMMMELRCGRV